jgi:hypothetical protein
LICINSAVHIVVRYIIQQMYLRLWVPFASYYLHLAMQVKMKYVLTRNFFLHQQFSAQIGKMTAILNP